MRSLLPLQVHQGRDVSIRVALMMMSVHTPFQLTIVTTIQRHLFRSLGVTLTDRGLKVHILHLPLWDDIRGAVASQQHHLAFMGSNVIGAALKTLLLCHHVSVSSNLCLRVSSRLVPSFVDDWRCQTMIILEIKVYREGLVAHLSLPCSVLFVPAHQTHFGVLLLPLTSKVHPKLPLPLVA